MKVVEVTNMDNGSVIFMNEKEFEKSKCLLSENSIFKSYNIEIDLASAQDYTSISIVEAGGR